MKQNVRCREAGDPLSHGKRWLNDAQIVVLEPRTSNRPYARKGNHSASRLHKVGLLSEIACRAALPLGLANSRLCDAT